MTAVKILGRNNSTYLIEWDEDGVPYRSFVPVDTVETDSEGQAYCQNPHQGVPHGIAWSMFVEDTFPVEEFENELHKKGIWTVEDLQKNPNRATSALQRVMGSVISRMRLRVLGEEK